jgi:hypothetical protein
MINQQGNGSVSKKRQLEDQIDLMRHELAEMDKMMGEIEQRRKNMGNKLSSLMHTLENLDD